MAKALDVPSVIAGEAVSGTQEERWNDMVHIASVIANRAQALGVTPQEVIANSTEFNAYNKQMPAGTENLTDMAQRAMDYVQENGPVTNATFYATPAASDNLPGGLNYEGATTGHQYFSDPQMRAIGTSQGFIQPNEFGFATNPNGIPTPFASNDLTNNSLLSAFQPTQQTEDPFSSILAPAPVDVQASGVLGGTPSLEANATARPMVTVPAQAEVMANPALEASATVDGISQPGFDNSRFDGAAPTIASDFDPGRFSEPSVANFDASRFGAPTINPATNTQSFLDQPAAPANLGSFPDAYAAQRGPTAGILSADSQTVQGLAEKQLAEAAMNRPALSVPSSGILAGNSPMEAQATVPELASAYTAPSAVTPAEQAITDNFTTGSTTPGILSGSLLSTASAPLTSSVTSSDLTGKSILSGQPVRQGQFVSAFPSAVANNTIEPATVNDVVAAPTLDTMQISEQPSIASVDGPATTNALDTQKAQTVSSPVKEQPTVQAAQNTKSFKDSLFSKETALGSILGGLVAGPPGAILGGIAGQQTARGGGLTGLLGGFSQPTTQIAGGSANIGGIYGGAYAPGTFAVANNGAQITAQKGGYTSITTPSGQKEVVSPTGQISHNFGSLF